MIAKLPKHKVEVVVAFIYLDYGKTPINFSGIQINFHINVNLPSFKAQGCGRKNESESSMA